jgi:hypothetical protein
MSKLKLTGPALLFVGFLLPSFAQDAPASKFAKQVEHDIAALSSQPSVGAWQELHPDEKLELMHYDDRKEHYENNLGLDFDSWCAASPSQSPSTFGRVAWFFVPSVKVGALPPLPGPGHAYVKESCLMQGLQYSLSPEIPIEDIVRELSSVWGTPDRSHAHSGKDYGVPENIYGDFAVWDHDGVSARLAFRFSYSKHAGHEVPVRIVLYAKRDAFTAAPCLECTSSLMYPLNSEKFIPFLQEAAQIAAQDPALTRKIVAWAGQMDNPQWVVDPALARNDLAKWLEVATQRPPHQRAAALLLADLYVESTSLGYAAKPDVPSAPPAEVYKGLGAEYDKEGNYVNNFFKQAEKMDDGGEVSELAALWTVSGECPGFDKRPWPDLAIEHVESFRARFPSDKWTPYVDFALARAHSAKLLWTYPGGSTDDYSTEGSPLSPAGKEHERAAAVEYFKAFIDARPDGRKAAFAWLEAWRLLAGLPPSNIRWGCTGE